jgi:hypothetical protein
MKRKDLRCVASLAVVVLALAIGGLAQTPTQGKFRGVFNDYTPQNVGGPWEVRGQWSLKLKGESGMADFSAALTMVHSDLGVTNGDLNNPKARAAHTHHVTLVGGTVTPLTNGFRVTGTATITGNGNYPPPFGGSSTLQVDITGGNTVTFSNIQMSFVGDAATHFGSQPINGVVRSFKQDDGHE